MSCCKPYFRYVVLGFVGLLVLIDQWTKQLAIEYLSLVESVPILGDLLHLKYLQNRGAAFGIFLGNKLVLIGLTGALLLCLLVLLLSGRVRSRFLLVCIGMILAGGVGNLIDRVINGYVVDFLYVKIINFAIFNLADCYVVVGTILVFFYLLSQDRKTEQIELS